MAAEGNDDDLVRGRQRRRLWLLWPAWTVGDRLALLPLGHGLGIDPVALRQSSLDLLTMLDRATDRLCRDCASGQNLAHRASFHSREKGAPSKSGIKHLVGCLMASTSAVVAARAARPVAMPFSRSLRSARAPVIVVGWCDAVSAASISIYPRQAVQGLMCHQGWLAVGASTGAGSGHSCRGRHADRPS